MSKYENGWTSLPGAERDADSVGAELTKQGFKVYTLRNPFYPMELEQVLRAFVERAALEKNNRVIIYYAGHGYKHSNGAYIVTTRGNGSEKAAGHNLYPSTRDSTASSFFELKILFEMLQFRAKAKHVLVVLDGCYLGQASDYLANSNTGMPPMIREYMTTPGRYLFTSSTRDQTVPDNSRFCRFFTEGIRGKADLFADGYVTLSELKVYLQNNVGNESGGKEIVFFGQLLNETEKKEKDKAFGEMVFFVPVRK